MHSVNSMADMQHELWPCAVRGEAMNMMAALAVSYPISLSYDYSARTNDKFQQKAAKAFPVHRWTFLACVITAQS